MALNTTLTDLIEQLRAEIGQSTDPAVSEGERAALVHSINRAYEFYHYDFDWPHLRVRSDKLTNAGQRYYDLPTDIDFDRVEQVETKFGGSWLPVVRGIENDDYDALDSESDTRLDPIIKWDLIDAGSGAQVEVWPLPATNNLTIRFTGFKKFSKLVSGSDQAVIDDRLIILGAAAKILTRIDDASAEEVLAALGRRYALLKGRGVKRGFTQPNFATGGERVSRSPRNIIAVHKES